MPADDAPPTPAEAEAAIVIAAAPDPATPGSMTPCPDHFSYAGIPGRLFYPAYKNGCASAPPKSPVVVVLRAYGNAYNIEKYDYLLEHLASHGYVALSLDVLGSPNDFDDASADVRALMNNYLLGSWTHGNSLDPASLALIGHSRGNGLARQIARDLERVGPWDVQAMVSLAGVDQGPSITARRTRAFLSLQGTHDGDVLPARAFAAYDEADSPGLFRAMKLLEGGHHATFTSDSSPGSVVTRGYIHAFLDAHVEGDDSSYNDYIRGGLVPGGWAAGEVWTQVHDGFALTVDDLEDGTMGNNSLGGGVFRSLMYVDDVHDLHGEPDTLHKTHAAELMTLDSDGHTTWRIPEEFADTGDFETLSFRIGQISGSASDDLRVQVRNGSTWSPEVRASNYGDIGRPTTMCTSGPFEYCTAYSAVDHMTTIRIPLWSFGATNNLRRIRLRFRGDGAFRRFYVDDVQLAEADNLPQ